MKHARPLLGCLAAVTLAALGSVALAQAPGAGGNAARGKQLYYDHACYGCHGYNGQTGAHNLVGTGSPIVTNLDLFIAFLRLRADVAPVYPTTTMPNYAASTLSDADARDIFTYIQTFKLDAPNIDDVPALRAIWDAAKSR